MIRVKKWWIPLLLGALLMATLVGVVWARPNARPLAAATTKRITIPAGWFHPTREGADWTNGGGEITSNKDEESQFFIAPVVFPSAGQTFTVEKMALYAYDQNGGLGNYDACVSLYKTNPGAGSDVKMAGACSTGSSTTDPRTFTETTIKYNPVTTARGAYLWLTIEDDTNLDVYGVRIWYHKGSP